MKYYLVTCNGIVSVGLRGTVIEPKVLVVLADKRSEAHAKVRNHYGDTVKNIVVERELTEQEVKDFKEANDIAENKKCS